MLDPKDDPSNPSSDYLAMAGDWEMIADIRAGAKAIKAKGAKYLPKYANETKEAYEQRKEATPWRPEFVDALRNLCSKPFNKAVSIQGEPSQQIKDISEDVDGEGNDLHNFARETFVEAVADGVVGIYVTFPAAEPARTAAEEKAAGVRPYWVRLCADNILALYTIKVSGRDIVQHIRIRECTVERDGFAEKKFERVRVIELTPTGPAWTLYEKRVVGTDVTWLLAGAGVITLPIIPIVMFFTGERSGNYQVKPPLADLAHMQMEIYRALSREDEILTYAGSPMLKAKNMAPPSPQPARVDMSDPDRPGEFIVRAGGAAGNPIGEITVGPKTVLFAPPSSEFEADWDFIQPDAANITAVSDSVDNKITHFRRLAMQPETHKSGNLTATAAAIDSAKAHTAIEVWANGLKDALDQAWIYTCQWLRLTENVEVSVHTDFGIDSEGVDEAANLIKMNEDGTLSRRSLWDELQRRGVLGPQFDADAEEKRLLDELPGDDTPGDIGASLTPPAKKPPAPSPAM